MKVAALLSWFDEPPELLARTVPSWASVCDVVVTLDGRYERYPDVRVTSPADQEDALHRAVVGAGMGYFSFAAAPMSQAQKRQLLFAIAWTVTKADWFFVLDADEMVTAGDHARRDLAHSRFDVIEVVADLDFGTPVPQRRLLRGRPDVLVPREHWRYVTGDGVHLWDYEGLQVEAGVVDVKLTQVKGRPKVRLSRRAGYYDMAPER